MKYIKLFENRDMYKIGEYVMYINKERVFGDQLFDKPELAQVLDVIDIPNMYQLYIKIVDDDDVLWCGTEYLRKLEPWELDAIKYNL